MELQLFPCAVLMGRLSESWRITWRVMRDDLAGGVYWMLLLGRNVVSRVMLRLVLVCIDFLPLCVGSGKAMLFVFE